MKLLFFGTPQFAVPSLVASIEFSRQYRAVDGSQVVGVVTQPDKPSGRGQKLRVCPVAEYARAQGLPVFQPTTLKDPLLWETWRALDADLFVVVAYGRILPQEVIDSAKRGVINVHASLLPKYRGAAPIQRALMNGETKTGVTTMQVVFELDAGPALRQKALPILESDTSGTLFEKLSILGGEVLSETLEDYQHHHERPIPQDPSCVTFAPPLRKEEGVVDWTVPAPSLLNRIRAVTPWPGAWTTFKDKKVKIVQAKSSSLQRGQATPGQVLHVSPAAIEVACGEGVIALEVLQLEGKKPLAARDFLNGFAVKIGESFT